MFLPLLVICAARVNAQRGASPQGLTQEVNRCLTVVRVAATRRRGQENPRDKRARVDAARTA